MDYFGHFFALSNFSFGRFLYCFVSQVTECQEEGCLAVTCYNQVNSIIIILTRIESLSLHMLLMRNDMDGTNHWLVSIQPAACN